MIQMYSHPFSKQVDILPENGYILLIEDFYIFRKIYGFSIKTGVITIISQK